MTTIKLRRGTAAQWITANPVLAAGEPGYETDSGKSKIGNGTATWATLSYTETLPDTIINAKGDLIVGTMNDTPARFAVSPINGYALIADSASPTGLAWSAVGTGSSTGGAVSSVQTRIGAVTLDDLFAALVHTHDAADIGIGFIDRERLPAGSVLVVDYVKNGNAWPSARPTTRSNITVRWVGPTDPGALVINGDEWKATA